MKNIVEVLISQHRALHQSLVLADKKVSIKDIVEELNNFSIILREHLRLENNEFYPGLFKQMEARGLDTAATRKFAEEMVGLEKNIYVFLDKYKKESSFSENLDTFKKELGEISSTLALRISSEEDGVYLYWSD